MKQKLLLLAAALATTFGLTSCPETNVPRQFGLKPSPLKPAAWEGNWASIGSPGEKTHFSVKEGSEGLLTITEPPKDGKPGMKADAYVRPQSRDKDAHLFFFSYFDKTGDKEGPLGLITKADGDNHFFMWHPNHEAIEKALSSGRLKGSLSKTKDGAHSSLAADPVNYSVLASPEFWDWTKPEAFVRTDPPKKQR